MLFSSREEAEKYYEGFNPVTEVKDDKAAKG
jgi:hypothetical protein